MYSKGRGWRDHLQVHPAADLFPLLSETDPSALKELAEDIRQHGQREPASYIKDSDGNRVLLDGRNRLDALEMLGRKIDINDSRVFEQLSGSIDAHAFIISKNIHRRHLSAEDKRDLIAKLLKAKPETSNRQVAKMVDASHPHIAKVRKELEKSGDVETVTTSIDTKGRKQPAKKQTQPKKSTSPDSSRSGVSQVSTAHEKLSSGLTTGSDSSELVPCSPAEARAAAKYQQEHDEIMRVQAERFVEKLLKTDIESARLLYRILDNSNVRALIFTLRDALGREFDGEDDGLDIPESLRRVVP